MLAARQLLDRLRAGSSSPPFSFRMAAAELDDWLADDRQWFHGGPGHWASLIEDARQSLAFLVTMSSEATQQRLATRVDELDRLRKSLLKRRGTPDDATRRELRRVAALMRADALEKQLLTTGWERLLLWSASGSDRAESGVAALRDLVELHGHVPDELFRYMNGVLADDAAYVAFARREPLTGDPRARMGLGAGERLQLCTELLARSATEVSGVVWLEYQRAHLWSPGVLELGDGATLYDGQLLRSLLANHPDDPRTPPDLRDRSDKDLSAVWFNNDSPDDDPAEPRVYLRLKFPPMSIPNVTSLARESADFLTALGDPDGQTADLWVLGNSYMVRGWQQSHSAATVRARLPDHAFRRDGIALAVSRLANQLAHHLPLTSDRLRAAARLLVWLRQAGTSSAPAKVVLCDRVVEQVCGWAGVAELDRFVREYLKPAWIYTQIRNEVMLSYWQLRDSGLAPGVLPAATEAAGCRPPHAPPNYWPSTNLAKISANLDALTDMAPGTNASESIERLQARLADSESIHGWIDELGSDFDRQSRRLRRTRNALAHGGPLATETVDHVSDFALGLAHLALSPTVDLLLSGHDVVDGLLDLQVAQRRCFADLIAGVPAADALFWEFSHPAERA